MSNKTVLVIAAHPDDEVLGAGGTIAKHGLAGDQVSVVIVTEGASVQFPNDPSKANLKSEQAHRAAKILGVKQVYEGSFPDQQLDQLPVLEIIQFLESVMREVKPQIVYTHHFAELNQDHRVCHEATLIATRPFAVASLERLLCFSVDTLSFPGNQAIVHNVYNDITDTLETKLEALSAYETEVRPYPHPRSSEALRLIAGHNGALVGLKAAEVFQSILEIRK
jgi:LmbE family N-acetylglucosaminyl deacetylase